MSETHPPRGWYPHPSKRDLERFWTGSAWSDTVRPRQRRKVLRAGEASTAGASTRTPRGPAPLAPTTARVNRPGAVPPAGGSLFDVQVPPPPEPPPPRRRRISLDKPASSTAAPPRAGEPVAPAPLAAPAPPAPPSGSLVDQLERLSALSAAGHLSAEEFAAAKRLLLGL